MKNTKKNIIRIMIAVTILFGAYLFMLWVANDFDPYFWQIDDCLDSGGRWNDVINQCETE